MRNIISAIMRRNIHAYGPNGNTRKTLRNENSMVYEGVGHNAEFGPELVFNIHADFNADVCVTSLNP